MRHAMLLHIPDLADDGRKIFLIKMVGTFVDPNTGVKPGRLFARDSERVKTIKNGANFPRPLIKIAHFPWRQCLVRLTRMWTLSEQGRPEIQILPIPELIILVAIETPLDATVLPP